MEFLAGAASALVTRLAIAPIDTLKIRTQLTSPSPETGFKRTIVESYRREGVRGYWKGSVSAIYLYLVYGGVQFYSLKHIRPVISHFLYDTNFDANTEKSHGLDRTQLSLVEGVSGGMAASVACVVSFPFDTIRTYHASLTGRAGSPSFLSSVSGLIRQNGVSSGLYKGLSPSLFYICSQMSIVFYVHEYVRTLIMHSSHTSGGVSSGTASLIGGMTGGFVGKTITMPLDVVRKRMQCKPDSPFFKRGYDSIWSSLKLISGEGYRGLFRGFGYACLKSVISSGVTFWSFAVLMKLYTDQRPDEDDKK